MTDGTPPRTHRPWLAVVATLLAWLVYRATNTRAFARRFFRAPHVGPDAAGISCEPWDISTGVTGYAWHAHNPRAVLLLQHGYAEYSHRYVDRYNRLIPQLLDAGVSVYAFDFWGHGGSAGKRAMTDVGHAVRDHLAARRKLREQPLPVFLLGHSLGALVTAASVVRDHVGVRGVVLMSGALRHDVSARRLLTGRLASFAAPFLKAPFDVDPRTLYHGAENDDRHRYDAHYYRGKMPALLAATGGRLAADNWKRYPGWKVPVLLMHGTADKLTNPEGSRRVFDAIAADDKTLHLVDGGYHELLNDTDRDATLQAVLRWLDHRIPPPAPDPVAPTPRAEEAPPVA